MSIISAQNPIPEFYHSGNGWMPDNVGNSNSPGTLYQPVDFHHNQNGKFYDIFGKTDLVKDLNYKMLRYNGIVHDLNRPTAAQYKQFVDSCRAHNIEPLIGLPFLNYFYLQRKNDSAVHIDTVIARAIQPGGYIHQILDDVTGYAGAANFFALTNEPDAYKKFRNTVDSLTSRDIFEIYSKMVPIIRAKVPDCKIVGPELTSEMVWGHPLNYSIDLIGGNFDITPFVDYYSYHLYPFPDCCNVGYSDSAMVNHPSYRFQQNLQLLRNRIASSANPNVKLAITEVNMVVKNQSNNGVMDRSSNSHRAGQFIASMWGEAQRPSHNGLGPIEMFQVWSIHESGGDPSSPTDFSILNGPYNPPAIPKGRSTYWHLWMMKFLQDKFYSGTYSHNGASPVADYPNHGIRAFASVEKAGIRVIVINQNDKDYPNYRIRFDNTINAPGSGTLSLDFNMKNEPHLSQLDTTYYPFAGITALPLKANTTTMFTFTCHGALFHRMDYTLEHALNGEMPKLRQINHTEVDIYYAACSRGGNLGGDISADTYFNGDTIVINSNVNLVNGALLSLDNCYVAIAEGVTISAAAGSSIEIRNSKLFGCNGRPWNGLEMLNGTEEEHLIIENSLLLNATNPVKTDRINVSITGNILANGENTAMVLTRSPVYDISNNIVGGFRTGLSTSETSDEQLSLIVENVFIEMDNAIRRSDDGGNVDILCNYFKYRREGIRSINSQLKDQGTSSIGAGNKFIQDGNDLATKCIVHSGSAPVYYAGYYEAMLLTDPDAMNIPIYPASADRECATNMLLAAANCGNFTIPLKVDETNVEKADFLVYPNPGTGVFNIKFSTPINKETTIYVRDIIGRVVTTKRLNQGEQNSIIEINTKGLFFVSVEHKGNIITQKIIVE